MDQWLSKRLSECLGFPMPDEMINFIMTLKEPHEIDDYFETLLDVTLQQHRLFLNDFKQRVCPKKGSNNTQTKNNNSKSTGSKPNPLALKQQNKRNEKQKTPPAADATDAMNKTETGNTSTNTGAKKKTKYVNLYGNDGTMNDVIMLKGRHLCNCQAAKHKFINNCIQCGRIVCEQEGSGPCLFCGNLVCTEDEHRLIESTSKKGENLKKSLMQQQRPKGWEEAVAMRNRLLDYDRTSEKRTTVIDDESDYFRANSVWLSDKEREKLKKMEQEMNAKKHANRRSQTISIDFAGRQVIEEPQITAQYEDEILKEIAETFSQSAGANNVLGVHENKENSQEYLDACHPLLSGPPPIFDDSFMTPHQTKSNKSKYDGVYNRVQDKELLEVSDLKKCMSMHQPWASLLVAGIKRHEGRPWYTSHRGRLWIAATAKPVDPDDIKSMEHFYRHLYNDNSIEFPKQYPSGCLLGCVLVQDCMPQEEYRRIHPNGESDSPFVFVCSNPQELPIRFPIKGAHKIYKLDDNIHIAAVKALQRVAKLNAEE